MAENLAKKPVKGILKTSSSFDHTEVHKSALSLKQQGKSAASSIAQQEKDKDIKWDEMNILQTLHPPDKDYGHMKIEEPKTPYSYFKDSDDVDGGKGSDNEGEALDAELLAKKISLGSGKLPKALKEEEESEEDENETEEERAKRKAFEYKRKMHYNEYYAVKLARKLMTNDEEEEEEDEEEEDEEDEGKKDTSEDDV